MGEKVMQYLLTQEEYDEYQRFKNSYGALKQFVQKAEFTKLQDVGELGVEKIRFFINEEDLPKIFKILIKDES